MKVVGKTVVNCLAHRVKRHPFAQTASYLPLYSRLFFDALQRLLDRRHLWFCGVFVNERLGAVATEKVRSDYSLSTRSVGFQIWKFLTTTADISTKNRPWKRS